MDMHACQGKFGIIDISIYAYVLCLVAFCGENDVLEITF